MIGRSGVEQALLEDEAVLEQVACLLEAGSGLSSWPEDLRAALALALTDAAMSHTESWKAVTLRRHLFGPTDRIPDHLAMPRETLALDRRRAERLRAGIPARVRYRAGVHLLKPPRAAT
jgi:phage tail protein X